MDQRWVKLGDGYDRPDCDDKPNWFGWECDNWQCSGESGDREVDF
jgi:hypothetical protein